MAYDRSPWKGPLEPGTLALCACGESSDKPYCDGSHARLQTGKTPHVVRVSEAKTYAICMCGTSDNRPWCDGSHKRLPAAD
ncbi:MAG: CDGSH iron-sulfur domain-containing protein [Gemmatimonadetes bacterium]|nr:CDGSH iron-sulfur domain-containing protein [Gemmatimonadota bacterium]